MEFKMDNKELGLTDIDNNQYNKLNQCPDTS